MLNIANHLGNANQNHNEISSHIFHNGYHQKRAQITNAGKNVEKRKPCILLLGMEISAATMETVGRFIKKLKLELPYYPVIPG